MFRRSINIPKTRSFFLFGARGTGKTTLVKERFAPSATKNYNLLDLNVEASLARDPMSLEREVKALPPKITHVVLDEIQKLPALLDVVHNLIETHKVPQAFILTGSSSRKLKVGGANMLGGRAALRTLFPLTAEEMGVKFDLDTALQWGCLPAIWNTQDWEERSDFLRSYANIYLKEEIWAEQLVRRLDPFRKFIEIAARHSGKILNYSNIAQDTAIDVKTVQSWYEILQDTLVGFYLEAFHSSVRKQLRQAPKFYFFDTGVTRALSQMLNVTPHSQTSYYGELFEQFVINQLNTRIHYQNLDYTLNYLLTKSDIEIDLVITRPNKPLALVEIKSSREARQGDVSALQHFAQDFPKADLRLWSNDPRPQKFGKILALPWQDGLLEV